ncbi:Aminopeptidase 2 mitochondrial [Pichia californica]|uniref:Aminopeptidase n=1 Tax=Pichia californica TaxID=460514 RepID=A0A9P6WJ41_9ASCO|nr:Aminopeptidase 2 mitochondrial [[Candida] californica]KAG0688095.1 Aminopeptidase 2 mitochondrial [[Candida] californica]
MCNSSNNVPGRQVLPTNIKPQHYNLSLEPLFDTFKFNGEVTIDLDIKESSDFITLHSTEIELLEYHVIDKSKTILKPIDLSTNEDDQTVTFKFDKTFEAGTKIQLYIKFIGELNDKMAGFYRSTYEEDGKTKYLATTQMEPTDCRRAFPSFDEPNLKAKFTIALTGDKNLTYLSNMDVQYEKDISETKKTVHFNTTPLMSTYLVAFIVGDLKYVESDYKFRDIPVRVYTTPGYEEKGKYSCELAAKALEYYEQVFDIKYPLPKMDMVGIHDFSAGAMENWGLITYRMVDLLFDESKSTLDTKLRVSEVVAHELAHQWFGNICTMDFWDSLWLNESFATYMSWKCCNHFESSWKVWENFVGDSLQSALTLDGLRSSHPIEVPVKRADEINQIFDAISYEKGSSVLRMLANWLGEDKFIEGVSHYLKKHAYGNAKTEDLWDSLTIVSGKDVASTMKVWTTKVGYPLVTVKESKTDVTVTQHRYLTTGDVKPEDDSTIYPIFLGLKTDKGLDESIIFEERSQALPVTSDEFFKVNGNSNGVFRVSYEDNRWESLGKSSSKLSVEDRIGLVADAGALSVSGFSKTSNLLSLVSGWKEESSFFVWDEIITRIGALKAAWIFEDEEIKNALKALTGDLVTAKCHNSGWVFKADEPFLEQRLKALLYAAAVGSGDEKTVQFAKDAFKSYIDGDKNAIHPNLRATIFNTVAAKGGEEEYHSLLKIYKDPQSMDEKIAALRSLGRFENTAVLEKVLNHLLDGTVRSQDIYIPMQGMRAHKIGIETLYSWMKTKWDDLVKLLPPGLSMLGSVVQVCTSGFTSMKQYEEIESFFKTKNTKGFDQGLAQSLETIKSKSNWVARDAEDVNAWLKAHGYLK